MDITSFRPDRPIEHACEDALRRSSFAGRLADQIHRWDGNENLVVGIHGEWGSGKSSVKNLVIERFAEIGDHAPRVTHFNPWMVSGEQHVAEAFFFEMELVLAEENLGQGGEKRAEAWRKYSRHFDTAARLSSALDVVLPFVGVLPGVGSRMAERLRNVSGLMGHAAGSIEGKTKSFDKQKEEVRELFKLMKRKLVIVIDDLDRLTDEEIRIMFRVIKATTDFPKTVFLLLFQKSTVAAALNSICGGNGELFLQKIIQVDIGLPFLEHQKLAGFLGRGMTEILGESQMKKIGEEGRLSNVWFGGLRRYYQNLRDVTRFLNSYGFFASGFCSQGVWEVDPVDLIVIETLRLFEPEVYKILADNKKELTRFEREQQIDNLEELAASLLEKRKVHQMSEPTFKELMGEVFPILQRFWRNVGFGDSYLKKWTSERRACIASYFDLYFQFSLTEGHLSEVRVAKILMLKGDREAIREEIRASDQEGILFALLQRLEAEEDFIVEPTMAYPLALSDLCDFWGRTPEEMLMSFPGSIYAHRAAYRILRRESDDQRRVEMLIDLIRKTDGLLIAAEWIQDSTKEKESAEWPRFDEATGDALKQAWVERVRRAKEHPQFVEIVSLSRLLRTWADWSTWGEVIEWLRAQPILTIVQVLNSMAGSTTSDYGNKSITKRWISWKSLNSFGELDYWRGVAPSLRSSAPKDKAEEVQEMLQAALARWEMGQDDSDSHFLWD